jgi:hypothetical protein
MYVNVDEAFGINKIVFVEPFASRRKILVNIFISASGPPMSLAQVY